jgi:tetratricopeptide (TPR) repeat protein
MRLAIEAAQEGDLKKADGCINEAINDKNVGIPPLCQGVSAISFILYAKKNYKDCREFSTKYLQQIDEYAKNGHDHNIDSKLYCFEARNLKALSTYRDGDTEKGRKMMDECLSVINSEVEQYRGVNGMDMYISGLYYMTFMMYDLGYDIFGAEQTLLNLDALALISPFLMSGRNKPQLLECRGNCYLLLGDKENARKLWQQVKDINPNYFKEKRIEAPLKTEFGE